MDVELRAVPPSRPTDEKLGDRMASAGPWQGETEEEILGLGHGHLATFWS